MAFAIGEIVGIKPSYGLLDAEGFLTHGAYQVTNVAAGTAGAPKPFGGAGTQVVSVQAVAVTCDNPNTFVKVGPVQNINSDDLEYYKYWKMETIGVFEAPAMVAGVAVVDVTTPNCQDDAYIVTLKTFSNAGGVPLVGSGMYTVAASGPGALPGQVTVASQDVTETSVVFVTILRKQWKP